MQQRVKKIIEKLAKEYNVPYASAELAVVVYYEKIKEVLEKGNFPEHETFKKILIPGFGRFIPNERKIIKTYEDRREREFREYHLGETPGYKLTPEYCYLQSIRDNHPGWRDKGNKTVQHGQSLQTGGGNTGGIQDQTEVQQDDKQTET